MTALDTAGGTGAAAVAEHHSALEGELIRRTEALIAVVTALEPDEPARRELLSFVRQEVLPHTDAEDRVLRAVPDDAPVTLLARGMAAQRWLLGTFIEEVEQARTPMDAAMAASALLALFMARVAQENTALLPALLSSGADLTELAADEPMARTGVGVRAVPADADRPADGRQRGEDVRQVLDLRHTEFQDARRQLAAALRAMEHGRTLVVLTANDLLPLRYEMEALIQRTYRWSLPEAGPGGFRTRVELA